MGSFGRGWGLAKQSLTVVLADGSLSVLVVLGAIATVLVAGALLVPAAIGWSSDHVLGGILIVAGIYCATATGVFFAVALAAAAADVLDGRDATVGRSLAVAGTRLGPILGWALILTTVNVVLQLIRERAGILGQIVAGIAGVAWGLTTFLVVPIVALEGLGARDALSRSGSVFRERWGDQIVGQVSISGVFFVFGVLPGLAIGFLGFASGSAGVTVVLVAIAVIVVVVTSILAAAARSVFSVALYRFATGSGAPEPFSQYDLERAVRPRRRFF